MTLFKNIRECYNHIPYTWNHYLAFMKVQKKLLGKYTYIFHDWDKLMLFIFCPFLGERFINQFHQKKQKHHPTFCKGENWDRFVKTSKIDWVQAIIDWECARITKPDKPLDAYDTLYKFYPEFVKEAKPYFVKLGLWR